MTEQKPENRCVYCGKSEVVHDIHIGLTAEVGDVGLSHKKFITGTEPLYADLCMACGSIVRLRVQTTDRKWGTKKPKT